MEYRPIILSAAKSILLGKYEGYAEDAVQNALISIANNIVTVSEIQPKKLKNFLIRTAKNRSIDLYRHENRYVKVNMDDVENLLRASSPSPMEEFEMQELIHRVIDYISKLGDRYQEIMTLRIIKGLTEKEIASLLGMNEKVVNIRIFRGRQQLKNPIREEM